MNTTSQTPNRRILLIDDNPSIHEDFKKILVAEQKAVALDADAAELFGMPTPASAAVPFQIDSTLQGQEGLKCLQHALDQGAPHALAFVDMRMPPGWDGLETVLHLWEASPDLQVVICTAFSDYSHEELTRRVGHPDNLVILKKPFDNIEVLQLAHALTRKWSLTQQARARMGQLDQMVVERTRELQAANEQLHREIQDRAQAQAALRLSEERLITAFKALPIPFVILTAADDRFVDFNLPFLQLAGFQQDQVLGRPLAELRLWIDPSTQDQIRQQLKSGGTLSTLECQLRTRKGETCQVLVSAQNFALEQQQHILLLIEDVSERARLEIRARQSQKMEAIGQLAAGVAHDFNNLLTIIQGQSELGLTFPDLTPRLTHVLSAVSKAAERAAALTRQLLAFSRKQVFQPKTINLSEHLAETCKMVRRLIGENIEFSLEVDPSRPLLVCADPISIEQIILNLAINARDAMPAGGRIRVKPESIGISPEHAARNPDARAGSFICMSVADTGCGMDATTLARIFEPFFTTKSPGSGTGLGLATVYGIVAQLAGWIEVSSMVGQGSTFKIYLPQSSESAPAKGNTSHIFRTSVRHESILVVEDEAVLREFVQAVLEQNGYRVYGATDGAHALELWRQHRSEIDLLLTDIVMPGGVSGLELARQLQTEKPELAVVLSTGYSIELVRQGLPSAGEDVMFLAKPYRPQKLTSAVRACLDRCRKPKVAA